MSKSTSSIGATTKYFISLLKPYLPKFQTFYSEELQNKAEAFKLLDKSGQKAEANTDTLLYSRGILSPPVSNSGARLTRFIRAKNGVDIISGLFTVNLGFHFRTRKDFDDFNFLYILHKTVNKLKDFRYRAVVSGESLELPFIVDWQKSIASMTPVNIGIDKDTSFSCVITAQIEGYYMYYPVANKFAPPVLYYEVGTETEIVYKGDNIDGN